MKFDSIQLELTKEIVDAGLEKAAESMSFFAKEKVKIQSTDVQIQPISHIEKIMRKDKNSKITVLKTKIIGDLTGVCYYIFSKTEIEQLLKVTLPESILNDPEKLAVMSDEMLLEMDNIIVASTVTQLSNYLKAEVYGDVPKIEKTTIKEFTEKMQISQDKSDYFLYFSSDFEMNDLDINPDFIWLLDGSYFKALKKVEGKQREIIEKIRSNKR